MVCQPPPPLWPAAGGGIASQIRRRWRLAIFQPGRVQPEWDIASRAAIGVARVGGKGGPYVESFHQGAGAGLVFQVTFRHDVQTHLGAVAVASILSRRGGLVHPLAYFQNLSTAMADGAGGIVRVPDLELWLGPIRARRSGSRRDFDADLLETRGIFHRNVRQGQRTWRELQGGCVHGVEQEDLRSSFTLGEIPADRERGGILGRMVGGSLPGGSGFQGLTELLRNQRAQRAMDRTPGGPVPPFSVRLQFEMEHFFGALLETLRGEDRLGRRRVVRVEIHRIAIPAEQAIEALEQPLKIGQGDMGTQRIPDSLVPAQDGLQGQGPPFCQASVQLMAFFRGGETKDDDPVGIGLWKRRQFPQGRGHGAHQSSVGSQDRNQRSFGEGDLRSPNEFCQFAVSLLPLWTHDDRRCLAIGRFRPEKDLLPEHGNRIGGLESQFQLHVVVAQSGRNGAGNDFLEIVPYSGGSVLVLQVKPHRGIVRRILEDIDSAGDLDRSVEHQEWIARGDGAGQNLDLEGSRLPESILARPGILLPSAFQIGVHPVFRFLAFDGLRRMARRCKPRKVEVTRRWARLG